MARKTKTAIHGQKKKDFTVTLTPQAAQMLDARANALKMSRSEMVEQIARNQISTQLEEQLLGECSAT
jgi:metal-responsive CopG/Arc/MetJ family transcriptional regulator